MYNYDYFPDLRHFPCPGRRGKGRSPRECYYMQDYLHDKVMANGDTSKEQ